MIEILTFLPLALIPAFMLLALVHEARTYEKPRWWKTRMTLATLAVVAGAIAITAAWSMVLGDFHLFDGAQLGTWAGAAAGIVVYEFVHYWYHRTVHRYDWAWRFTHQMHHSAEVLDAFSANYLHPLDLVMFTTWSSLVFFPLLGLSLEAGLIAGAWLGFNTMFQHANIHTPRWLGYVMQRPESHVLHHERGQHRYNYANLPLWDMIFGTFRNPANVDAREVGFYLGGSTKIADMLLCRDISQVSESSVCEDEPVEELQRVA